MNPKAIKLSSSMEDYIEAIAEISESTGCAHTKDIALRLNIKMPSVTSALRLLSDAGLVIYQSHRPVELTSAGHRVADAVISRHRVLHQFFHNILMLEHSVADNTACSIEHIINDETLRRIAFFNQLLQQNRQDSIKFRELLSEGLELMERYPDCEIRTLSNVTADSIVTIISDVEDMADLDKGEQVEVLARSLDGKMLRLLVRQREFSIPVVVADNIWSARKL